MLTTTRKRDRWRQVTGPRFLAARAMERAAMRGALAKTSSSLTSLSGAMKSMSSDGRKKVERSICAWNLPGSLDWTTEFNMVKRCETDLKHGETLVKRHHLEFAMKVRIISNHSEEKAAKFCSMTLQLQPVTSKSSSRLLSTSKSSQLPMACSCFGAPLHSFPK